MTVTRRPSRRGRVVLAVFGVVAASRVAGWVAKRMAGVR